jgi:hypothetical protein
MHMLDNSAPAKYTNTRSHKKLQVMELYIINALLDKPSPQQSSARNAANHTHGHAEEEKLKNGKRNLRRCCSMVFLLHKSFQSPTRRFTNGAMQLEDTLD